ncbi:hypothetical protein [Chamaesiphon minutus]|jgi:mannose/fructose/N-acetylgalactosamine-specific phosphotransferase system component IIC|uniref:Uncharacterized protein n=1 Tax=Chamaesiphon minutus (strain ATCC 27169 / PCC 6605) TaxID=1173020 RepID=K9UR61_CHAP6|nr:hypothetical protein [Chamaesiphon minutus]AFY97173.1 hypothetical protein Cha6605_6351 [Chamaesiphon minutus PCC 6605]
MSKQIKLAIGSILALATLGLITTGAASAQERSCGGCCKKMQQSEKMQSPVSTPSSSYSPGYIRGK